MRTRPVAGPLSAAPYAAIAWIVAAIIVTLNVKLLYDTLFGG